MECGGCGFQNPEGARFCGECGRPIESAATCPSCGAGNAPSQKFCNACGHGLTTAEHPAAAPRAYTPAHLAEKILRSRAAIEGEQRIVTVLFADAVGSVPLAQELGAEKTYSLMQGCLSRMMDAVHRFEGTVTQFRGDGIMALFGAPIAHEDSSRRGVAAALEMQAALKEHASVSGVPCSFRVGLNTGPVVVGSIGDDLVMDYTALGDTVNLAARLEEGAEPGTVLVSDYTYRAIGDFFDCEPAGPLRVRGKADPVAAYKVICEGRLRTRFEAAASRGLTPFVGRERELAVLRGYLEQAERGQGQVVAVSGEAGIGKSRLMLEFRRSRPSTTWLEGHCISYGRNIPYLPVVDLLKRFLGVEETDDDARIVERVERVASEWDEDARGVVPYLRFLLSVDPGDAGVSSMDARIRRAGIFDALRALFVQETKRRGPLIAVVEDLHWIDELSQDALARIVDVVASLPVLLVLTYRPGYVHALGDHSHMSRIALGHLPPDQGTAVAAGVLGAASLPAELTDLLTSKAEGNPFYIEEVTKSLVEVGALSRTNGGYTLQRSLAEVRIPDTIQEVILARIDRLEPEPREAIQLASVIGREFTVRVLDRISNLESRLDAALGRLRALELIYEKAYFPELAYMFKHALTHDVAYSTMLGERRKALHRIVAAAIEELYSDRLPEYHEALAHHYAEAEVWPKALEYLGLAGDKTAAAYANTESLDYYARAIEVAARLEDWAAIASLAERRGLICFTVGDLEAARADYGRMLAAAQTLGDRSLQGLALSRCGMIDFWAHEFDSALELQRKASDTAGLDDLRVKFSATFWTWTVHIILGELDQIEALQDTLVELGDGDVDTFDRTYWVLLRGMMENWEGRYAEALACRAAARDEGLEDSAAILAVGNLWMEGLVNGGIGEYEKALDALHRSAEISERLGEGFVLPRTLNTIGWIYCELQDHERALEYNRRGAEFACALGWPDPECESNAWLNEGDSLVALGRLDEAAACFDRVEAVVREPTTPQLWALWLYSQHLYASYGDLWLGRGDHARALGCADECLARAGATNRRKNIVKGRRLRAQALIGMGELDEAGRELDAALAVATEIGNPPQLWKTWAVIGELRRAQGREAEAREAYRESLGVIDAVAANIRDDDLRETFLGSQHVDNIRKASVALEPA